MKRVMYLLFALIAFEGISSAAVRAKIGELYYNLYDGFKTASVTYEQKRNVTNYDNISKDVVIPRKVRYKGVTYTVVSIGEDAFYGCFGIGSIKIPREMETIAEGAFSSCYNLSEFYVDAKNQHFSSGNGFLMDKSGERLMICPPKRCAPYIRSNVKYIQKGAFCDGGCCTLINVSFDNPNYSSVDGVLFNKDKTKLIKFPKDKNKGEAYSVPNSVKIIGEAAFSGCELTSISIGDNVTTIEASAFTSCKKLKDVTIGRNLKNIGKNAFRDCKQLSSVTILSKDFNLEENVFENSEQACLYANIAKIFEEDIPIKPLSQVPNVSTPPQVNTSTMSDGYVDLGLPSGTLWKEKNEEYKDMPGEKAYYHMIDLKFNGGDVPTREQWEELQRYCTWKWNGNGCVVRGKNGHSIVLPAAGYFNNIISHLVSGETPEAEGVFGFYWSSTKSPIRIKGEVAFYTFSFYEQNGSIEYGSLPQPISICYSVRLVRKK